MKKRSSRSSRKSRAGRARYGSMDKKALKLERERVAEKIERAATRQDSRHDAADLAAVAALVRQGRFGHAVDRAWSLDTIIRDELPKSFFRLLKDEGVPWQQERWWEKWHQFRRL